MAVFTAQGGWRPTENGSLSAREAAAPASRPPSALRRALRASLWLALAFTVWTAYVIVASPGAKFPIVVVIFIPPIFAAYFAAALPPSWLGFKLAERLRESRWPAATAIRLAIAGIAAAGLVAPFLLFNFCVPNYFTPAYRYENVERVAASDFVASWGARMIALAIPAHALLKRPAQTLWVAESELSRGEYARLTGTRIEGEPSLPVTSLSRAQVEALFKAMNAAAPPAKAPPGRYRLPTFEEMLLYSGDWWITSYPKWLFHCQSSLGPVGAQPENGLGLRGTVDNAAELVSWELAQRTTYCITQGGVAPFCGHERSDEGLRYKSVGLSACEDRNPDKVWNQPGVGIRVVFSADS